MNYDIDDLIKRIDEKLLELEELEDKDKKDNDKVVLNDGYDELVKDIDEKIELLEEMDTNDNKDDVDKVNRDVDDFIKAIDIKLDEYMDNK